jgi:hypothetical protein
MSSGAVFTIEIDRLRALGMRDQPKLRQPNPYVVVSIELKQKCAKGSNSSVHILNSQTLMLDLCWND